jgi:hypothetical protein
MNVTEYRADETVEDVLRELLADCDAAFPFDAAGLRMKFEVYSWFVFPRGSLLDAPDVELPA